MKREKPWQEGCTRRMLKGSIPYVGDHLGDPNMQEADKNIEIVSLSVSQRKL